MTAADVGNARDGLRAKIDQLGKRCLATARARTLRTGPILVPESRCEAELIVELQAAVDLLFELVVSEIDALAARVERLEGDGK